MDPLTLFAISAGVKVLQGVGKNGEMNAQKKLNRTRSAIQKMQVDITSKKAITESMKKFEDLAKEQERMIGTQKVAMAQSGMHKNSSVARGVERNNMEDYYGAGQQLTENIEQIKTNALRQKNMIDYGMKIEEGKLKDSKNQNVFNTIKGIAESGFTAGTKGAFGTDFQDSLKTNGEIGWAFKGL